MGNRNDFWNGIRRRWPLLAAMLLYVVGALCLSHTPFFWDSVSVLSRPAGFLYETGFSDFSFPSGVVSDNLPLSALLAGWWMLFGRTLFSTHILFMLFGLATIYQIYALCSLSDLDRRAFPYVFFLVLSDAALTTQLLVPMFDSVLLLFTLLTLRYMFEGRRTGMMLGAIGLAMLRTRGVVMCAAIGAVYFCLQYLAYRKGRISSDLFSPRENPSKSRLLRSAYRKGWILPFLPALAVAVGLFAFQWVKQPEVFGLGEDSPWRIAPPERIFRNVLALPRFLLDAGRIGLWGMAGYLLVRYGWKRFRQLLPVPIAVSYLVLLAVLSGMTLPFANPYSGRYFLALFVLLPLLVGKLMFSLLPPSRAGLWCVLLSLCLWSGHFWRYPESVARTWDSTLAHLPYYKVRAEALDYLSARGISPAEVRSFFPADKPADWIDLNGSKESFASPETPVRYALFSNLSNIPTPAQAGIDSTWVLLRRFEKGQVYISLYTDTVGFRLGVFPFSSDSSVGR